MSVHYTEECVHYTEECQYGTQHRACRCPAQNKTIRKVNCLSPERCNPPTEAPDEPLAVTPTDATLHDLVSLTGAWHRRTWGAPDRVFFAAKLAEEVGEVAEAAVKQAQDHPKAAKLDFGSELADVVIVAMSAASIHGIDLALLVQNRVTKLVHEAAKAHELL